MGKEFQKAADITPEMRSDWYEKYADMRVIEVPLDEDDLNAEVAEFYVRKPSRNVIEQIAKFAADKDIAKANQVLIKNCVIGGDMEYLDAEASADGDVYFAVLEALGELVNKKSEIPLLIAYYEISEDDTADVIRKGNSLIRGCFHIDPEDLSDVNWAKRFQEAIYFQKQQFEFYSKATAHGISLAFNSK